MIHHNRDGNDAAVILPVSSSFRIMPNRNQRYRRCIGTLKGATGIRRPLPWIAEVEHISCAMAFL